MTHAHIVTRNEHAAAARATVLARLLDSTEQKEHAEKIVAFPAFIPAVRCLKYSNEGGLWVMLQIPADYVEENYAKMRSIIGKPLLVSCEIVDPGDVDAGS